MLLEPGSEASLGLSDVDLSTRAWYLVHDVRLLLDGERVFDLSEHGPESRIEALLRLVNLVVCYWIGNVN